MVSLRDIGKQLGHTSKGSKPTKKTTKKAPAKKAVKKSVKTTKAAKKPVKKPTKKPVAKKPAVVEPDAPLPQWVPPAPPVPENEWGYDPITKSLFIVTWLAFDDDITLKFQNESGELHEDTDEDANDFKPGDEGPEILDGPNNPGGTDEDEGESTDDVEEDAGDGDVGEDEGTDEGESDDEGETGGEEDEDGAEVAGGDEPGEEAAGDEDVVGVGGINLDEPIHPVTPITNLYTHIKPKPGLHIYRYEGINDSVVNTPSAAFERLKMVTIQRMDGLARYLGRDDINTWDDVLRILNQPWQEGIDTINELIQELKQVELPEIKSHVRRTRFDEAAGDELDYDRMRNGQEYWRQSRREKSTGSTEMTILTDLTTSYVRSSREVLWRGAAAIALASIMEDAGYRTELWVVHGGRADLGEDKVVTGCCVKRTSSPLDLTTIAQSVSAWYYRGTVLPGEFTRYGEINPNGRVYQNGLCDDPSEEDLDHFSRDENRVYIHGVFSKSGALSLLEHTLNKIKENE